METAIELQLKVNDIFKVSYSEEYRKSHSGDLNHCFEGLARVAESHNGFILCDTFWGLWDGSGRTFSEDQIGKDINITFYCNLDEIEQIAHYEADFFDEKDVFCITRQHGCMESCKSFFKRRGAERSRDKMETIVRTKISKIRQELDSKTYDLVLLGKKLLEVETAQDLNQLYV